MFLSLCFSLPSPLPKKKKIIKNNNDNNNSKIPSCLDAPNRIRVPAVKKKEQVLQHRAHRPQSRRARAQIKTSPRSLELFSFARSNSKVPNDQKLKGRFESG